MKRYCRNCFHPLPYKAKFCAHCGQKDTDGRIGLKSLLGRLWNNTFHLEGKFIRTSWQLFVPGMVSVAFFKGKQDRYPHPIRMFAIVMFLFLFLLNSMLKGRDSGNAELFTNSSTETEADTAGEKKSSRTLYDRMKYEVIMQEFRQDYEQLPSDWKTPQSRQSLDSLLHSYQLRYKLESSALLDSLSKLEADSIGFGTGFSEKYKGVQIAVNDLVRYEPEEIIQRYHITQWYNRLLVRQGIKSFKTPDALIHAMVGSLTWAILALVALMSGVLALLYIRQKRYYVEHFIFLLHFHTGALLLLLIAILGEILGVWGAGVVGFASFLPIPGLYFALLRYYGQGWFKTFLKWGFYSFCYLIAFVMLFVLGMIVVFAIF